MSAIDNLQRVVTMRGAKADVEALVADLEETVYAYASDSDEIGIYTGGAWVWIGPTTFAVPALTFDTAAAAGAATTAIRSDSQLALFDATPPVTQAFGDAAATGSAGKGARRDHRHGMPDSAGTEVLMQSGITDPPTPLTSSDGTDWLYGTPG